MNTPDKIIFDSIMDEINSKKLFNPEISKKIHEQMLSKDITPEDWSLWVEQSLGKS